MKELIKATLTPSELRKYALKARFWDQWTQEECRLMASAYLQLWNNAAPQVVSEGASLATPQPSAREVEALRKKVARLKDQVLRLSTLVDTEREMHDAALRASGGKEDSHEQE